MTKTESGKKTIYSAPGKIYLCGEHAVVYGEPAIACAIDLRATARVSSICKKRYVIKSSLGISGGLESKKHIYAAKCIEKLKGYIPKGVEVEIESEIPAGSGLGSSAATIIATLSALNDHFGTGYSLEEIAKLGHKIEKEVQGAASPTDTFASAMGGMVFVPEMKRIELPEIYVVIGNTGKFSSTKKMVLSVKNLKNEYAEIVSPILESVGNISREVEKLIKRKDYQKIGKLMDINQGLLDSFGIGTEELSKLIWTSRKAGAWGSKITGAGGGGCMIAIAKKHNLIKIAEAIEKAGGKSIITKTTNNGVKNNQRHHNQNG